MKKKEKFIQLHKRLLDRNHTSGLCCEYFNEKKLGDNKTFKMFEPNADDRNILQYTTWWAANGYVNSFYEYTLLRQNIILFCAAINGEL